MKIESAGAPKRCAQTHIQISVFEQFVSLKVQQCGKADITTWSDKH
jgi:predicted RNA-binding Zn-ribbon protein involved in translation (DUF1610 family)